MKYIGYAIIVAALLTAGVTLIMYEHLLIGGILLFFAIFIALYFTEKSV